MTKNKKIAVVGAGVLVAGAALGLGAMALFSDTADTTTGATAGTVSVVVVNPDLSNKTNINPGDNDATMWASLYKNDERHYIPTSEDPLFNASASHDVDDYESYVTVSTTPHDLTFTVANTGTKSIRTRQTFVISCYQANEDGSVKEYLPAEVFTMYEDGTYYGTKGQNILNVADSSDYKNGKMDKNQYVDEFVAAGGHHDSTVGPNTNDNAKIVNAYVKSMNDESSQPWEELAYKYLIDEDDNEYLVSVPDSDEVLAYVGAGAPTDKDVVVVPEGVMIKAVKYVVYSDVFDGVTDDNNSLAAEIEGSYGEKSNLGDESRNFSEIPDAYHVQSKLNADESITGCLPVYYKDQNSNIEFATPDGKTFYYYDAYHKTLIGTEIQSDGSLKQTEVVASNIELTMDGTTPVVSLDGTELVAVELNTEFNADGTVKVGEDGKFIVHAYNAREYSYLFGMAKMATNKYQGATVKISVVVEAMQYRNTDGLADWNTISTNLVTTALDFSDDADSHTNIVVPDRDEEPLHKGELESSMDGDTEYNGTTAVTKQSTADTAGTRN